MKKRHYGMLSLAFTSCLAVHAENKNQNTDKPNVIFIYADDLGYGPCAPAADHRPSVP